AILEELNDCVAVFELMRRPLPPSGAYGARTDVTHSQIVDPVDHVHVSAQADFHSGMSTKEILDANGVDMHPTPRDIPRGVGNAIPIEENAGGDDGYVGHDDGVPPRRNKGKILLQPRELFLIKFGDVTLATV